MRQVDVVPYKPPITNDTLKIGNAIRQLRHIIVLAETQHPYSEIKRHLQNLLSSLEEK